MWSQAEGIRTKLYSTVFHPGLLFFVTVHACAQEHVKLGSLTVPGLGPCASRSNRSAMDSFTALVERTKALVYAVSPDK